MKKTIISTLKIAAVTVILASCNNAEEAKKLQEADNAAIQTAVDGQLAGLQEQVNAECTAWIDSSANAQYAAWYEIESKKPGKKPAVKPKPKPTEPKKEEVKDPQKDRAGEGKTVEEVQKGRKGDAEKSPVETQKKRN